MWSVTVDELDRQFKKPELVDIGFKFGEKFVEMIS